MVESIAEKEIQKDPIDFIRRESFQVDNEDFYTVHGDDDQIEGIAENDNEDDEDYNEGNEYHEEEKAVARRIGDYKGGENKDDTSESIQHILTSHRGIGANGALPSSGYHNEAYDKRFYSAK